MIMNNLKKSGIINKNFIIFFMIIAQASFGSSVATVALAFLVLKITGSASAMALTLGLRILPNIFMPFIATFLDRGNIKIPFVLGFVIRGILLVLLYVGVHVGAVGVHIVYLVALINGVLATIVRPSCQILIPSLLGGENLERGNSVLNIAEQSMTLIGYMFGGIMVSAFGPIITLLIEGICYLICGILMLFMAIKASAEKTENSFLKDMLIGLSIMRQFKVVAITITMCFFINVFFALVEVYLPLHMQFIAKGGVGYGVFMSLMMIGMLLSSTLIAFLGKHYKTSLGVVVGWLALGIAFFGLGRFNSFYQCMIWAVIFGVGISFINLSIQIILQKTIQYRYRGRVNGISVALSSMGMPLAFILISYTMPFINFKELFVFGAFFAFVFSMLWFLYIRKKPTIFFEQEFMPTF